MTDGLPSKSIPKMQKAAKGFTQSWFPEVPREDQVDRDADLAMLVRDHAKKVSFFQGLFLNFRFSLSWGFENAAGGAC